MPRTKVIIAGCGIAGPVLAILLKQKGYVPIVYERTEALSELGLSLCLQPNGLRVLALIPGLLDKVGRKRLEHLAFYSALPGDEAELGRSDAPALLPGACGFGVEAVRRPVFLRALVDTAQENGVRVVFGHPLVGLEEHEDRVVVRFANGQEDEASFVVGCDGLHSNTRACLFGKEAAVFTGLTQTGGISHIPEFFAKLGPSMVNIYGDGVHLITYQINDRQMSWAITQREAEERETWRNMDEDGQRTFKEGPFARLPFGGGELVRTADKIVKFGLYDRPELQAWHKGRVLLIGDAAHPTSPHLGQGANQALEDTYHTVRLLVEHNPAAAAPSTALLSTVFAELERLRIPRTAALVRKARAMGESRVLQGAKACRARDGAVRAMWAGARATEGEGGAGEEVSALYGDLLTQPFEPGKSEI
ncbi:FAD/NAD-P-binding domain-containing protein [Trametes elegans]|nr:FAD/NAD-P-binding domain-containing protein [Trametes elegans]